MLRSHVGLLGTVPCSETVKDATPHRAVERQAQDTAISFAVAEVEVMHELFSTD